MFFFPSNNGKKSFHIKIKTNIIIKFNNTTLFNYNIK